MRIFDTHCHIADPAFDADRNETIARFIAAGVCRANVVSDPCEDIDVLGRVTNLLQQHDYLYASIGVHPHNASKWSQSTEEILRSSLKNPRFRLLGEIGLDYHYDLSPRDVQRKVFSFQLGLAHDLDIPVQLHIREAHGDTIDIMRAYSASNALPPGIMHCYAGSWESARFYLDCGYYISLSGSVTFKNASNLQEVVRKLPEDRILIETDCPYLSPVPNRGKRNEPSFIVHTLEMIAKLRNRPVETIADILYTNSLNAFRLQDNT